MLFTFYSTLNFKGFLRVQNDPLRSLLLSPLPLFPDRDIGLATVLRSDVAYRGQTERLGISCVCSDTYKIRGSIAHYQQVYVHRICTKLEEFAIKVHISSILICENLI